jgi:hypothetical protein
MELVGKTLLSKHRDVAEQGRPGLRKLSPRTITAALANPGRLYADSASGSLTG